MADFAVVLVHSTSHAIQAERVLSRANLEAKLIPTPRHLSSDCGSAIRINAEQQAASEQALGEAGVPIERIVALET